ncbi:S9 family peptidase [Paeniglutamicibacter antarcticus]|uniref:S9 family peptidase n=1 Tax=Arthrobacter terrae TaxID=2935737 RepID=A0A931CQM6_9MICC|nr:prolyl oligopeptidase family serine peptidase [Arthrobacter terrae]MBG0740775.1 S9 family peptidase [Arthrobacter terrae]
MTQTRTQDHLPADEASDEFQWLEDIHGDEAITWVREHNDRTDAQLLTDEYTALEGRVLGVMDSADRIPLVNKRGDWYYNFWRDQSHPRGLWRRTSWAQYQARTPEWQVLLDIDELSKEEDLSWVWSGASMLRPATGSEYRSAMVALSAEGGDAVTYREFDLSTQVFVPAGFILPAAKTRLSWRDADTLYVGTDLGAGSMTASSYPSQCRILHRGQSLAELAGTAPYFQVPEDHLSGAVSHDRTPGFERDVASDVIDFFRSRTYLRQDNEWVHIDVPEDVNVSLHRQWLLLRPQTDWELEGTIHPAGSLLVTELTAFLSGSRQLRTVFVPDVHTALQSWSWSSNFLLLNLLQDVSAAVTVLDPAAGWAARDLAGCPPLHSGEAFAVDDEDPVCGDDYWLLVSGFLTPTTLLRGTLSADGSADGTAVGSATAAVGSATAATRAGKRAALVRQAPSFFNADDLEVQQHFAESADGTRIPYFQVGRRDLVLDGANPTLLSGYGGFEVSRTPAYSGALGRTWLERRTVLSGVERGGVYVLANIRGGGEYGPLWHRSALQENRHKAYEDFAAVARDLMARGVTSRSHLGCSGGSNGGLLVGNMLTGYPELFGAISCGVPLLDMRRYTKLSAGASWVAEYGDPDVPAQWEFIRTFSPYHLLRQGVDYPPVFLWTATSDDRVGPVQARKMAARMEAMGIPGVWFHEALEGGHAGASNNRQAARLHTASHEFLWRHLAG